MLNKKVLSIIIASYNVEKTIGKTLDSLIDDQILDKIEVIVVNDGSKDNTINIVNNYVEKYPNSIFLINKENGGYGSVINVGVEKASGKYLKLLDGDDWVDTVNFKKLVITLEDNENIDVFFNKMYRCYPNNTVISNDSWKKYIGNKFDFKQINSDFISGMWELTFKTDHLKTNIFSFPMHTFYTDHLFIMIPLVSVKNAMFLDYPVYCYRLGDSNQSVSIKSRINHINDIINVAKIVTKFYIDKCSNVDASDFARTRASFCYTEAVNALLLPRCSVENYRTLKNFNKEIKEMSPEVYKNNVFGGKKHKLIKRFGLIGYFVVKIFAKNI